MINLQTLATKLSSLLQRIDHGVPAAAMNAINPNTTSYANILTMSDPANTSTQGNQEHVVQHGSSTWLERPTIVIMPSLTDAAVTSEPTDGYVPVSSLRRFRPMENPRLDQPQDPDATTASSGSRFAPLQDDEEEIGTWDDQDTVTEFSPKNRAVTRNSATKTDDATCGEPTLTDGDRKPAYIPTTVNIPQKSPKKHKKSGTTTFGWHQARLPQGHAQIKKPRKHMPSKERKLASPFASRKPPKPPAKAKMPQKAGHPKLKPPPPIHPVNQ